MVLYTDELRVSRSFAKTLRKTVNDVAIELRLDSAFDAVVSACAGPRDNDARTWITEGVADAYIELHRRGLAHSMETWVNGELTGGLYGVALGRMFYGESMFSYIADASKIALAATVQLLRNEQVRVIDCQQNTRHLASLGAREIPRREFVAHLTTSVHAGAVDWPAYANRPLNALLIGLLTDLAG
jgi:leucyl/phenylalanyl-tRNA--protein transferase